MGTQKEAMTRMEMLDIAQVIPRSSLTMIVATRDLRSHRKVIMGTMAVHKMKGKVPVRTNMIEITIIGSQIKAVVLASHTNGRDIQVIEMMRCRQKPGIMKLESCLLAALTFMVLDHLHPQGLGVVQVQGRMGIS